MSLLYAWNCFCDMKRSFSFSPFAKRSGHSGSLCRFLNSKAVNLHSSRFITQYILFAFSTNLCSGHLVHTLMSPAGGSMGEAVKKETLHTSSIYSHSHLGYLTFAAAQPSGKKTNKCWTLWKGQLWISKVKQFSDGKEQPEQKLFFPSTSHFISLLFLSSLLVVLCLHI